jgi:release factor glutamine methyltransferase
LRKVAKYFVGKIYKPLLVKYLSKTRTYTYEQIKLSIPTEVFHPAFFFSTKILINYIRQRPLHQKSFLELGAGSGLISLVAAKMGANVMATDINPVAITYLKKNQVHNNVEFSVIHSDMFEKIPAQGFDIIAINPPYYKKRPESFSDFAWYCGENGEYFEDLFSKLALYIHPASQVLMILSDECDMVMIQRVAGIHAFELEAVYSKKNLIEKNTVYKIVRAK